MAAEGRNTKGAGSAVLSRRLGGRQHPSRPDLRVNGLIGRRTDPAVFTWPERLQSNMDAGRQHATSGEAAARALGTVPTSPGPAVTHTESAGPGAAPAGEASEKCDGKVKCLRRRNARPGGPGSPPAQAELGPRIEASPAAQPGAARTQRRTTHFARLLPVQDTQQPRHLEEQNAITGAGSVVPWTQSPRRGRRSRRKPADLGGVLHAHQGPQLGAAHGRVARHMGSSRAVKKRYRSRVAKLAATVAGWSEAAPGARCPWPEGRGRGRGRMGATVAGDVAAWPWPWPDGRDLYWLHGQKVVGRFSYYPALRKRDHGDATTVPQ